jgi:2-oxoglutarate/2-oxoacid ferredoxin oxidoreductase subunit alpha
MVEEDGLEGADVVVVSYGITSRVAHAGRPPGAREGVEVGFLRLKCVWPFPEKLIRELAGR